MKFLIVTASLVTLNAAVAADLPHPHSRHRRHPSSAKLRSAKLQLARLRSESTRSESRPSRSPPKADAKTLLRPRADRRTLFLCIGVRRAFSRRCDARGKPGRAPLLP
jgi:hypothetical protein